MRVVTINLLNRFWKNGVKPIKEALEKKIDITKIVKSIVITEEGFLMDGKTASEALAELDSNCVKLPDYEHMEDISHGYVAERPGYVFVGLRASVDRFIRVSINGSAKARICAAASTSSSGITYSPMVVVRPGDVIDYNLDATNAGGQTYSSSANFVPFI